MKKRCLIIDKFKELLFIIMILCLSSCGNDSEEPINKQLEGVWGLTHMEYYYYDSDLPESPKEFNPYDPTSSSDQKMVIVNTKDDTYLLSLYYWNISKETWVFDKKYTAVLDGGKLSVQSSGNNNFTIISFNSTNIEIKVESNHYYFIKTFRKLSNEINYDNNGGAQKNSDNDNKPGNNSGNKNENKQKTYYVKYTLELSYKGTQQSKSFSIEYKTESGVKQKTETIKSGKTFVWEDTFGPFKVGDKTSLKCKTYRPTDNVYYAEYKGNGKIYIKEDDGPFSVKSDGSIYCYKGTYSSVGYWNDLDIYYYIK